MIKNTFRFWLMATLVLATVYLISNPTMASKMGSQASQDLAGCCLHGS